jgi:2-oxoglutarate dehydrogenase E1 component
MRSVDFHGPNAGYIAELYELYLQSPDSFDDITRQFFQHWSPPTITNGATIHQERDVAIDNQKIVGAVSFAQAIRQFGHLDGRIDPLGSPPLGDPELTPEAHGITENDLRVLPAKIIGGSAMASADNAWDAIQRLREVYSGSIGYDNEHIRIPEERQWLREAAESRRYRFTEDKQAAVALLQRLTQVEAFEHFLQRSFPTKYRFSIEGLDMMVPILDEVIELSAHTGMSNISIAMAHRGRLNVLAHIMNKPYEQILADFKDPIKLQQAIQAIGWTIGDVKYHKGVSRQVAGDGQSTLTITMPPNPSHLEFVNPVAVGIARAAGTKIDHPGEPIFDPDLTMQILIHGDAAFPGQGIVSETFNLSRLPGYWTGGTIHIIANNQIGFTTLPSDGRSTLYASDLAKGFKVPIIHVNADDPAACIEVARIAFAYQDKFEKDILIDLVGYRRYGHNELDEPGFTQPVLYQTIRDHPTVRELWVNRLKSSEFISNEMPDEILKEVRDKLQVASEIELGEEELADHHEEPPAGAAKKAGTAVDGDRLIRVNNDLEAIIDGFAFYSSRLENTIRSRRQAVRDTDKAAIDWANAEELAFATILEDGTAIRFTGQDSERGTFSHRHAVLHDANTGETLIPLQRLPLAQAAFEIHNSPLSEAAALGFEYGYNVQAPERLVLWEAQYGDFSNGAQTIIDEFILSAREKWGQTPSLVMLLPHGHEGAGPDHSSARPERFLQLAAKTNVRVANPTTAAQYFHLLRRQAALLTIDPLPLIVMTPKSLLRNPEVASSLDELANSKWQAVIDDAKAKPGQITRLVFVSGKFYYDLVNSDYRAKHPHVALARVEQLYPFPVNELEKIVKRYKNLNQIVWAQEEPKNMGGWDFMNYRIKKLVGPTIPVNYVGRRRSSSPAEGSSTAHKVNQSLIVGYAFEFEFNQDSE